jgi:hypothetical protein
MNVRSVQQFLWYKRMFDVSTILWGTYECPTCPPVSGVHTNVRRVHQFLGYVRMCEVTTSLSHMNVRSVHQFLWYVRIFEVSTSFFGTYECSKCPPVSLVRTNVRNVHQFLWYVRMFEVSTSFFGTYECSKCPPVSLVHTNVRSVHQFLGCVRMFEVSVSFFGSYECSKCLLVSLVHTNGRSVRQFLCVHTNARSVHQFLWYIRMFVRFVLMDNHTKNWSDIFGTRVKIWRSLSVEAAWHPYTIYFLTNSVGRESLCTSKLEAVTQLDRTINDLVPEISTVIEMPIAGCITLQDRTLLLWRLGMELALSSGSIYIQSRNTMWPQPVPWASLVTLQLGWAVPLIRQADVIMAPPIKFPSRRRRH